MGSWTHLPDADWRNDGWSLVGSGSALWQILDDDNDSDYLKCPGYRGEAVVRFPVDITAVPAGAVITSVTISIRAWLGSGSPDSDDSSSITVDLSSFDDMAKRLSRTVRNITSTPTTYTVATWKKDPLGLPWDIQRVNQIMVRAYSYEGISDLIRVGQLYCTLNYRVPPSVVITSPTGTVFTSSPTLSWTYSQPDGDQQDRSEYRIFTAAQQGVIGFDPSHTAPVFDGTVSGDNATLVLPTSLNVGDYWIYVRAWSKYEAFSPWTGRQFTIDGPSPGVPGVPPTDNSEVNGVGEIQSIVDGPKGAVTLTVQDTSNMLSVQDADAETVTDGTTITGANTVSPPVRNTSNVYPGSGGSWQMTSLAAGDMTHTCDWAEIAPAQPMTATVQVLAGTSARNIVVGIQFYDQFFNALPGRAASAPVLNSTSTWTQATVTATSPKSAFYARMYYTVQATGAAGETHYADLLGLMYGTNTPWSDGGHMSRNLLSSWYSCAEGLPQPGEAWSGALGTLVPTTTAPTGLGASGNTCFAMTYAGVTPSLGYRATGAVFTSPTLGGDYTLNAPAGLQPGDLMIAFVRASAGGLTILPPAGWTLVDASSTSGDSISDVSMFVLKRSAAASEPSSWTDGSLSGSAQLRSAVVVAYSGAADASRQFIGEASRSTTSNAPAYLTSPTVNNTDPNAWRVSSFAFVDDTTGGSLVANVQAPTINPIAFVGRSSAWTSTSSGGSFTINRPANMQQGDFLYASLAVTANSPTVAPPSGWTLQVVQAGSGGNVSVAVMWKFAGASEPTSWSGSLSGGTYGASHSKVVECSAYRYVNATPFLSTHSGGHAADSTETTGVGVYNSNSRAWFVSTFAAEQTGTTPLGWSGISSPALMRTDDATGSVSAGDGIELTTFDSNGPVSTGTWSISANYGNGDNFEGAAEFIAILNPLSAPVASGANETQRGTTSSIGTTNVLYGGVFDSGAAVSPGAQSVTGIFTPGDSDGGIVSAAAWVGIIAPATQVRSGYAQATMASTVDISGIDQNVMTQAGTSVAASAIFSGTSAGTPYITVNFYRANQLLDTAVAQGSPFPAGSWTKSAAVFPMPAGTTRMSLTVAVADRAVGDVSYWDRVSLSLGDETVYRPGTSRAAHPIWSVPQLEYTIDDGSGFTPWAPIPGSTVANPTAFDAYSGLSQYVDHTVKPLTKRKYRARTLSYGLGSDRFVSPYGPESNEFQYVAQFWWLKDISNPDNNVPLDIKWDTFSVDTTNTAVVYQALGEDKPVVLTEGFKAESFTVTINKLTHDKWLNLLPLLTSGHTLYLQSDIDKSWWVRVLGDIQTDVLATDARKLSPLRELKVTFVEVDQEP